MAGTSTISNLDIVLRGNTSNLDASLGRATGGVSKFKDAVASHAAQANASLANIGNNVSGTLTNALQNPVSALQSLSGTLLNAFLHPIDTLKSALGGIVSTCRTVGQGITSAIGGALRMLKDGIVGIVSLLNPAKWLAAFSSMASGIWSCVTAAFTLDVALAPIEIILGAVAIAAVALTAAIGGVGAAFLYLGSQQAPIIASMHRSAQTIGMTTEAFSRLANTSGMDVEQFTGGMERLERTLADAAQGGGEAAAALGRVGLNANQLMAMNPDEQLNRLANAMQGVTNQGDRLRLAHQLFGRSAGPEFVQALQRGQAGLDEFRARADRFGLTFTGAQAETVKRSNKAWGEWKLALQGIGNSVAIALAPAWEYVGTVMGNFFGKIAGWVRSSLPYIEMIWTVTKEVLDDISAALAPARDWFVSAFEGVGNWIGETIRGAIPFVRETWNIIKAITSAAWDLIKSIVSSVVDYLRPLWTSFVTSISGVWRDFLQSIGASNVTWEDFKTGALKALITIEFGINNLGRVSALAWDMIKLKMLEWAQSLNPVLQAFQNFINALIDGFNSVARGIAGTMGRTINGIIDAYNSVAARVGGRQINFRVDVQARQFDRVNLLIDGVGDRIAALREGIRNQLATLGPELVAFVDQRLAEINRVATTIQTAANDTRNGLNNAIQKNDNKAAERGSVEAYSIMVGQQQDKVYSTLNDILREIRNGNGLDRDQLRELQRRATIAVARL